MGKSARNLSTVQGAFKALAFIAAKEEGVEANEVANFLGKSLSSAYTLLNSLSLEGLLQRRGNRFVFVRAVGVASSRSHEKNLLIKTQFTEALEELYLRSNERAYLALWNNDHLELSTRGRQGLAKPPGLEGRLDKNWHALALGKAILAFLNNAHHSTHFNDLPMLTPQTITDTEALEEELARVRSSGLAVELEEYALGFSAVAAPILGEHGEVLGAIGLLAPASRFPFAFTRLARDVSEVAFAVSKISAHKILNSSQFTSSQLNNAQEVHKVLHSHAAEEINPPLLDDFKQPQEPFWADQHTRDNANLKDCVAEHARSLKAPELFWDEWAKRFTWFTEYRKVRAKNKNNASQWFVGGTTNICYNAVDRHALGERRNQLAIVSESGDGQIHKLSYRELHQQVCKLANVLKDFGVGLGDRVAMYLPTGIEAAVAMLACARIGALHVVMPAGLGAVALRERILDTGAKVLIAAEQMTVRGRSVMLGAVVQEATRNLDLKILWHCRTDSPTESPNDSHQQLHAQPKLKTLMQKASEDCEIVKLDSEHPLFILYTSGSTGKPKGIVHVHGGYMVGTSYHLRNLLDLKNAETIFVTADLAWIVGHSQALYGPLLEGLTTVLMEDKPNHFGPEDFGRNIQKHGVNVVVTTPTWLRKLYKDNLQENTHEHPTEKPIGIAGLRLISCAGEYLAPEILCWTHQHFGVFVIDQWWQTETGAPVLGTPLSAEARPGQVGLALPGADVAVVDSQGLELPRGEKGFLVIRDSMPQMFRSIWNNNQNNTQKNKFQDSEKKQNIFYASGDLGIEDNDGYFRLLGRSDDAIKVGEHRVGASEIETVLMSHVAVAEAAVIAVNDGSAASVRAFVVLRQSAPAKLVQEAIAQRLKYHLRRHFGPLVLNQEVLVVTELPRTKSGKILRRVLRAQTLGHHPGDLSTLEE